MILSVLVALLIATLAAFAAGWTFYPFGVVVLVVLIAGRIIDRNRRP